MGVRQDGHAAISAVAGWPNDVLTIPRRPCRRRVVSARTASSMTSRGPARTRVSQADVRHAPVPLRSRIDRHRRRTRRRASQGEPGRRHRRLRPQPRRHPDRDGPGLRLLRGQPLPHGCVGPPHRARRSRHGRHGLGPRQRPHRERAAAEHLRHRHQDLQCRHRRADGAGRRQRHPGGDHAAADRSRRPRADHRGQPARRDRPRQRPDDAGDRQGRAHRPGELQPHPAGLRRRDPLQRGPELRRDPATSRNPAMPAPSSSATPATSPSPATSPIGPA